MANPLRCAQCNKPVYFAEQNVALGRHWHRQCFKCGECRKVLQLGNFSEHGGVPYCSRPCYRALFGPRVFKQGLLAYLEPKPANSRRQSNSGTRSDGETPLSISNTSDYSSEGELRRKCSSESSVSCGDVENSGEESVKRSEICPVNSFNCGHHRGSVMKPNVNSSEIQSKVKDFNQHYANTSNRQINSRMMNGQVVLEGQLRIHWGTLHPIRFKQKDDGAPSPAITSYEPDFLLNNDVSYDNSVTSGRAVNGKPVDRTLTMPRGVRGERDVSRYGSVVLRGESKLRRNKKRVSILNGHLYNAETNVFVPTYGSVSTVIVTSNDTSPQVIKQLLDKFKVETAPEHFCLCIVKNDDDTKKLLDSDFPLIERIRRGPNDDTAKIFIMEKTKVMDINEQVREYMNLPEAVLHGFLDKLKKDEEYELSIIKERRTNYERRIQEQLSRFNASYL